MKHKKFAISIKGGAAKGLGAIGVVRLFQEESLQPEVIAGSSAGAIVAAMYTVGMKWFEMSRFVSQFKLLKMVNIRSIIKGSSVIGEQNLREIFSNYFDPDLRLEDLPNKLVIFTSNPKTNTRVYITKGNLITALMASMAYPVILPSPVNHSGQYLIDGDLTSSYSTSYLKTYGVESVIGIRSQSPIPNLRKNAGYLSKINKVYGMLKDGIGINADLADPCDYEIVFNPKGQSLLNFGGVGDTSDRVYAQALTHKGDIFKVLDVSAD